MNKGAPPDSLCLVRKVRFFPAPPEILRMTLQCDSINHDPPPSMLESILVFVTSAEFVRNTLFSLGGFLIACVIGRLRERVRTVEFAIKYAHVALPNAPNHFETIRVMYQGQDVANLYWASVDVFNTSGLDLTDLGIHVMAGDGRLLSEYTAIAGTGDILRHAPEYRDMLVVPAGQQPSQHQMRIHWTTRRYLVPVFNRGQTATMSYLITVPTGETPGLAVSMQHKGIRSKFRVDVPRTLGIPTGLAARVGLIAGVSAVAICTVWLSNVWLIAYLCFLLGGFGTHIGALLTRAGRFFWSFVAR